MNLAQAWGAVAAFVAMAFAFGYLFMPNTPEAQSDLLLAGAVILVLMALATAVLQGIQRV